MRKKPFFSFGLVFLLFSSLFSLTSSAEETLFIWPAGSSDKVILGYNETYIAKEGEVEKKKTHWGIDIGVPEGTEMVAAADGKVIFAGFTPSGRGTVSIEHPQLVSSDYPEGLKTTYLQLELAEIPQELKKSSRKNPVEIKQGEFIGKVAAEGDSSSKEPHFHFGLVNIALDKNRKSPDDPNPYLDPQTPGFLPMEVLKVQPEEKISTEASPILSSPEVLPTPILETMPVPEATLAISENPLEDSLAASLGASSILKDLPLATEAPGTPLAPMETPELPQPQAPVLPDSLEPVLEAHPAPIPKPAVEPLQSQQGVSVPPSSPAKKAVYLIFFSLSLVGALFYLRQRFFHLNLFRPFAKVLKGLL